VDTQSEQNEQAAIEAEASFGKAIVKGILITLPVGYLFLVGALLLMTDWNVSRAFETAILPGVLIGVFFGGFAGVSAFELARTRRERAEHAAHSGRGHRQ
jgi:hypothetical protein